MAALHGIINFFKPTGITSAKALYAVRKVVGQRKSGHAGTLDPGADGVLVLCLGQATKLVDRIMDQPKVYHARARLDVTSESYDSDRPLAKVPIESPPSEVVLAEALRSFQGDIEQVPPAVSAVKVGGRPAYQLERRGQTPELKARTVRIHWIRLRRYAWPQIEFEMACGRGTYVRALMRDLGRALGTGGCLTALTRTAVGPFAAEDAWTLAALRNAAGPEDYLIDLDRARQLVARQVSVPRPVDREQPPV